MKFGYIIHSYGSLTKNYSGFNIGDPIQTAALLYLYDTLGIKEEERTPIFLDEINNYDREYVFLPMLSVGVGIQFAMLPLSQKIIPLFISTHIAKNDLYPLEINYLKSYEPIGCRDEHTMLLCRRYGIKSYMSGCITAILPSRESQPLDGTIYVCDEPDSIFDYIPKEYLPKVKKVTHLLPLNCDYMSHNDGLEYYKKSLVIFDEYKNSASLVIASRMHALLPCIAMGIPVIGAFENISYRFSAFDKFIKLYTEDEFCKIDWNPVPVKYEKAKLLAFFQKSVKASFEKYNYLYDVSSYYEDREKSNYGSRYTRLLNDVFRISKVKKYIIWGCGLIGNIAYDIMSKDYPNAKLICAVDSFVEGKWHNVEVIKPNELINYVDCFIILATFSGKKDGYEKMQELGKKEGADFVYIASQNG